MNKAKTIVGVLLLGAASSRAFADPAAPEVLPIDLQKVEAAAASRRDLAAPEVAYSASLESKGTWTEQNGWSTWGYALQLPGAVSLAFHAAVAFPPGATLSLAGADGAVLKTYDALNSVAAAGHVWSILVPGDTVVMTLTVPTDRKGLTRLNLDKIFVGVKPSPLAQADSSVVRAATVAPVSWSCDRSSANELAGDATLAYTVDLTDIDGTGNPGLGLCTGTLLADVPRDNREFLLTAAHCGATNWDASTLTAYWNAVSPCGSLTRVAGAATATTSGGTTRAVYGYFGSHATDFNGGDQWLIELSGGIPEVAAGFAGWIASDVTDASTTGPSPTFGINQGAGMTKQYTASTDGPTSVSDGFIHYNLTIGSISSGASGSGLFNSSQQLFATLTGADVIGPTSTTLTDATNTLDNLLSQSWHGDTGNNDPASSTGVWLDPGSTGALSVMGYVVPAALPTVTIMANAQSVTVGEMVLVYWTSSNSVSCQGSDGLASSNVPDGAFNTTATAVGSTTYTMTCTNAGGSTSASVTVAVTVASAGSGSGGSASGSEGGSGGAIAPGLVALLGFCAALRRRLPAAKG